MTDYASDEVFEHTAIEALKAAEMGLAFCISPAGEIQIVRWGCDIEKWTGKPNEAYLVSIHAAARQLLDIGFEVHEERELRPAPNEKKEPE